VKRYISSPELAQKPLLVLPHEKVLTAMAAGFSLVPTARRDRNVPKRPTDWLSLARDLRSMYGCKYDNAAKYLEDLAHGRLGVAEPVAPLPWHTAPDLADGSSEDYVPHACVLSAIAPSIPLQTIWRRTPNFDRPRRADDP